MAIIITDECINCGACEPECPNNAIYEAGAEWAVSDGTGVSGSYKLMGDVTVDADAKQEPVSDEVYYIVPDKCTECQGFHEEPQCAAVCPVDCCVPMTDYLQTMEEELESSGGFGDSAEDLKYKIQRFKDDKNLEETNERLLKKKEILHV